ncbi:uncharacterized protein LOC131095060 [Melospiza georgiana]|uniref:uncharacterized protein LOC131095060 n=1 Tax=Melospiza georgiana TaxID=44398 RepID=UPI0025AC7412|nr:uncharacterized protein LOC131095060 [Melospiza georgiana]
MVARGCGRGNGEEAVAMGTEGWCCHGTGGLRVWGPGAADVKRRTVAMAMRCCCYGNGVRVAMETGFSPHLLSPASASDTREVIGAVGGSVTFRSHNPDRNVALWSFGGDPIVTVVFKSPPRLIFFEDKFKARFAVCEDGHALSIPQLRMEDAGTYSVAIGDKRSTFTLQVFRKLAEPTVTCEAQNCSGGSCSSSLRCSTPGTGFGNVFYTWRVGNQTWDGSSMVLQVNETSQDGLEPVTCTARNAVSSRNVTVTNLGELCAGESRGQVGERWGGLILIPESRKSWDLGLGWADPDSLGAGKAGIWGWDGLILIAWEQEKLGFGGRSRPPVSPCCPGYRGFSPGSTIMAAPFPLPPLRAASPSPGDYVRKRTTNSHGRHYGAAPASSVSPYRRSGSAAPAATPAQLASCTPRPSLARRSATKAGPLPQQPHAAPPAEQAGTGERSR